MARQNHQSHKAYKCWKQIVTVLAVIMTFTATYALLLPSGRFACLTDIVQMSAIYHGDTV